MSNPKFTFTEFYCFIDNDDVINFEFEFGFESCNIIFHLPYISYKIGEKNICDLMIEQWTTNKDGYIHPLLVWDNDICEIFYRRKLHVKEIIIRAKRNISVSNFNVIIPIDDENAFLTHLKECSDKLKNEEQLAQMKHIKV